MDHIPYPHSEGTQQERIDQILDYLFQMANQINFNLAELEHKIELLEGKQNNGNI